ncbi:hypothetical protein EF808_01125 [archaeon]|nr:MAG: hypothetical protein EF808_01125 [archaeon]
MKMPKQKKKLDPKILERLLPLTILAFVVGVGGVWFIRNYITNNDLITFAYIIVFWLIFQSKFVEIVRGPEYFKKRQDDASKKAKETRKKYGGKPR